MSSKPSKSASSPSSEAASDGASSPSNVAPPPLRSSSRVAALSLRGRDLRGGRVLRGDEFCFFQRFRPPAKDDGTRLRYVKQSCGGDPGIWATGRFAWGAARTL